MPDAGALVRAFGNAETDDVATNETTTSTSFTDLTTVGPSVTVNLLAGQSVLILFDCHLFVSASGVNGALATVEIAGPSSSDLAAADANGIESGHVNEWTPGSSHLVFTATSAGDHTIKMVYRVIGAITGSFKFRRLAALPLA